MLYSNSSNLFQLLNDTLIEIACISNAEAAPCFDTALYNQAEQEVHKQPHGARKFDLFIDQMKVQNVRHKKNLKLV